LTCSSFYDISFAANVQDAALTADGNVREERNKVSALNVAIEDLKRKIIELEAEVRVANARLEDSQSKASFAVEEKLKMEVLLKVRTFHQSGLTVPDFSVVWRTHNQIRLGHGD
jgi:chromosome segregation ATPase